MSVPHAKINYIKKEGKMIATALALQEATQEAVFDESTIVIAKTIAEQFGLDDNDDFIRQLFVYSSHLSALTASLVTNVCLTKDQLDEMINVIKEFDTMSKEME
jgi:hypothetical protein